MFLISQLNVWAFKISEMVIGFLRAQLMFLKRLVWRKPKDIQFTIAEDFKTNRKQKGGLTQGPLNGFFKRFGLHLTVPLVGWSSFSCVLKAAH